MKINKDDKYVKISFLVFLTCVSIYIACSLVGFIPFGILEVLSFLDYVLELMSPVIIAFIIAYLLLIPTKGIENFLLSRKHVKIKNKTVCRVIGVTISYITVLAIIAATFIGIYYMIGGQLSKSTTFNNIYKTIKQYFNGETLSADALQKEINKFDLPFSDLVSSKLGDIATFLSSFISKVISFLFGSVISLGGNLFNIVISVILSIYFVLSYEYFLKFTNKIYYVIFRNSSIGRSFRKVFTIINDTFSAYIRGQLIEAFIVAVLSTLALYIVGVDYALVIGIISGICNLIPYVGPLVGTILAGLIALLGGNIFTCIWAIVGMQIVQQLDANVICPRVVGNIVGLPAAFVIIAILVGGNYAGLLGMLIAVPIAASLKTIIGSWFDKNYTEFDDHYRIVCEEADMRKQEQRQAHDEAKQYKKDKIRKNFNKLFKKKH